MKNKLTIEEDIKDYGFRPDIIVAGEHYVMGQNSRFLDAPVLLSGGHGWGDYKPVKEYQSRGSFDSNNCSNYGTNNALETLANFHGFRDFPKNCSERYTGVCTGTAPSGNTPHTVIETIRTQCGEIPEMEMPFTDDIDSWDKYYSPNPMSPGLLALGKTLLDRYTIGHDWVFTGGTVQEKLELLKKALERGTVCTSVRAWTKQGDLYVKNVGESDTHWVQLLDFVEGKYWVVYDHYDDIVKHLAWEYDFGFAKVYYLRIRPKGVAAVERGILEAFAGLISSIFTWLKNI